MKYNAKAIGKRMKEARDDLDLTVRDVGDMIGVSGATISRYENGEVAKIKLPVLSQISRVLQVNEEWLLGISEVKSAGIDKMRSSQYPFIPDSVAAGLPTAIKGYSHLPYIEIPDTMLGKYANRRDVVIMKVNGDSMNNIIPNDSFVGIITDITLEDLRNGDLVVFRYDYEYSLKRYYNFEDKIVFKPDSNKPCYTDIILSKDEALEIIGKVIMYSALI